jgi:hypothetical protein
MPDGHLDHLCLKWKISPRYIGDIYLFNSIFKYSKMLFLS